MKNRYSTYNFDCDILLIEEKMSSKGSGFCVSERRMMNHGKDIGCIFQCQRRDPERS